MVRKYSRKELNWVKDKSAPVYTKDKEPLYIYILFLKNEEMLRVIPYQSKWSGEYHGMYKIRWANGDWSKDYYNLTWAKENATGYTLSRLNSQETASEGPPSVEKQLEAIKVATNARKAEESIC